MAMVAVMTIADVLSMTDACCMQEVVVISMVRSLFIIIYKAPKFRLTTFGSVIILVRPEP